VATVPRFVVLTPVEPELALRVALDDVGDRFPEVEVLWGANAGGVVCRAPSETHVRRYMDAAGINVRSISRA
jgi:hypothetical protein